MDRPVSVSGGGAGPDGRGEEPSISAGSVPSRACRGAGPSCVAVLSQGEQDPGLAALINSLVRHGFAGTMWVGWRGAGADLFRDLPGAVSEQIDVRLVELETRRPLTNHKAAFIEQVWGLADPDVAAVVYMDCDIVLGCEWGFIEAWVAGGLALVEDLPHRPVGVNHPLRRAWKSFMAAAGVPAVRELGEYFNAGFVGVPHSARAILPVWNTLARTIEGMSGLRDSATVPHYLRGTPVAESSVQVPDEVLAVMRPYLLDDQDALNMAVMGTTVPICSMGPDAMGFTSARTPVVVHALGPEKPWSTHYLRRLIRHGKGPSFADDMWWSYSDGPLRVGPAGRWTRRRAAWVVARALRRYL